MKKIIAGVVVVVVIWVGLKMIGVDLSVSLSPNKDEVSEKKKLSPDNIIGLYMPDVSFPKSATDIHCDQWNADRMSYWIVAKLPKQDFYDLVEQLELKQRSDLLEFWPDAFDLKQGWMRKYWDLEKIANEDTYHGDHPEKEASIAIKYESGKIYLQTIVTYIVVQDENGNYRYDGIKKR